VHPLLTQSYLLQEDVTLSQNLSALAAAGLQALDFLEKGQPAPDTWKTQQLALIAQAKTRQADMLLMVVTPVQQLVEASAAPAHN
jgi:thiamine monophosphate synthase